MTTYDALLSAVCDRLDDRLPRLVLADHVEEQGQPEEAAAWRATADRRPQRYDFASEFTQTAPHWVWWEGIKGENDRPERIEQPLFAALPVRNGQEQDDVYRDYPAARAALLDLIAAWVAVEREKAEPKACSDCRGQGWYVTGMDDDGEYTAEVCPACRGKAVAAHG